MHKHNMVSDCKINQRMKPKLLAAPHNRRLMKVFQTSCAVAGIFLATKAFAEEISYQHAVETQLLNPRQYPDDKRRWIKPPDWNVFGNETHFTTMRGFHIDSGRLVHYSEDFERNSKTYDLGDVIWPNCSFLTANVPAANMRDMIAEMKQRNLFLYQIWGYVPGSGPGKQWPQFRLSPETSALFESQLGDHWLGMDMGEQDGRYVLGYASSMTGISDDRVAQFLNFHRYMEQIGDDCGNKMAGLAAITFSHYYGKEGIFTMLGAEAAQSHPNGQVFYAFIRGAGRQYGVPWFGNASVYNRWGWKTYDEVKSKDADKSGPTKGTSLALMKRLLYSHILYNCMVVGFEGGWLSKDRLTPIGKIQQAAQKWVRANGQPGVMQTPIAVMTDFYDGWIFPSYNPVLYRAWGNLPYNSGDYLMNNVMGMIYPGYQDSSFFHDERGFLTATPYGDAADVLLSDVPECILKRYPLLVVAGQLSGGVEMRDKLEAYIEQGGRLYITAGSLKNLPDGLAGITVGNEAPQSFQTGQKVSIGEKEAIETNPFELLSLHFPNNAKILAKASSMPAAVSASIGKGSIIVFASPFGIGSKSALAQPIKREEDKALANPYPMLNHVSALLDAAFREQMLFEAGEGLDLITCRRANGDYTLGVANNSLAPRPFTIVSHVGDIKAIEEIPLDQSEKTAVGYLPEGFENAPIGRSDEHTIAGGDIRVFRVRVSEKGVVESPSIDFSPAPRGRFLAIGNPPNLEEALLARPTFFQHFDGVLLDWKYVFQRDRSELEHQAGWLKRQQVHITIDLSSGVDLFPGFRLVNNYDVEYNRSLAGIAGVIEKMDALGAHDLVLPLHTPAGYFSRDELWSEYARSLGTICKEAQAHGVTIHLRNAMGKMGSPEELLNLADKVGVQNLKLAVSTGPLLNGGNLSPALIKRLKDRVSFWLVSTPRRDMADRVWTTDAPLAGSQCEERVAEWLKMAPDVPVVANAVYAGQDDEYRDICALEEIAEKHSK